MRYACIARHVDEFEVRLMCEVLEVSPSGYYAWRKRPPSARALADERLLLNVRIAHAKSGRTYGAPRVQRELRDDGIRVGTKRVARLMRSDGLQGRAPRRRRVSTTDSAHAHPIAPNLLARQFDVHGVALNQVWVSDITYIPTAEGWLYLAAVLDLASRRWVGWAMRDTLDAELAAHRRQRCPRRLPGAQQADGFLLERLREGPLRARGPPSAFRSWHRTPPSL